MPFATLHIAKVLKEREQAEGGAKPLSIAIDRANGRSGKGTPLVDRRKISALIRTLEDPEFDVPTSLSQLCAIDVYLERFGEGLAFKPFFVKPDILAALADAGDVAFFLGAKSEAELSRINLSHWDVRAMSEVQRGLNAVSDRVAHQTYDVLLSDELPTVKRALNQRHIRSLFGAKGPSKVCLASSRANPMAERMLTEMFGVPAWKAVSSLDEARRLPFHFVWKPKLPGVFDSKFHLSHDLARRLGGFSAAALPGDTSALVLEDGEPLVDKLTRHKAGHTYGVVAAQRRAERRVWVVLAGVTGPGTLACAEALAQIKTKLDASLGGAKRPGVVWAAVRAHTKAHQNHASGAPLLVHNVELVGEPRVWRPDEG